MQVIPSDAEIAAVEEWAFEGANYSIYLHCHNLSYEQGILDLLDWLRGDTKLPPSQC